MDPLAVQMVTGMDLWQRSKEGGLCHQYGLDSRILSQQVVDRETPTISGLVVLRTVKIGQLMPNREPLQTAIVNKTENEGRPVSYLRYSARVPVVVLSKRFQNGAIVNTTKLDHKTNKRTKKKERSQCKNNTRDRTLSLSLSRIFFCDGS